MALAFQADGNLDIKTIENIWGIPPFKNTVHLITKKFYKENTNNYLVREFGYLMLFIQAMLRS